MEWYKNENIKGNVIVLNTVRIIVVIFLMQLLSATAGDDCGTLESCSEVIKWSNYSHFTVTYSDSKDDQGPTFDYITHKGETLITIYGPAGNMSILVIDGVAILWRGLSKTGIKTSQECSEYVGDTFSMVQNYARKALFLLGYATHGGPEKLSANHRINVNSKEKVNIKIKPDDSIMIHGPWELKGNVVRNDIVSFEFLHGSQVQGSQINQYISGTWKSEPVSLPIDNNQSLSNWLVCLSDQYSAGDGKNKFSSIIDHASGLKTLEKLRALKK